MEPESESVRLSGVRGLIARRMHESLQRTAQLSFHATIDASSAIEFCQATQAAGRTVSLEDVAAWVYAQTLRDFPDFNGVLQERHFQPSRAVHLGLAIGVTEHLTVAVVRDAHAMDISELADARRTLVDAAREGALSVEQMRDATSTISNLGKGRTEAFTPILNPPQVVLLGLAALRKAPWITAQGELVVRPVIGVSLTVDHQWIDGAPANAFLAAYCERLEVVAT